MDKVFVICKNDFPDYVLPVGISEEDAEQIRKAEQKKEDNQHRNGQGIREIYVHIKKVTLYDSISLISKLTELNKRSE